MALNSTTVASNNGLTVSANPFVGILEVRQQALSLGLCQAKSNHPLKPDLELRAARAFVSFPPAYSVLRQTVI